jgi:hypothetical protein
VDDPRVIYLSDWSGNNVRVSPNTNAAFINSSLITTLRAPKSDCGSYGQYIAILDNVVSNNYQSLVIYDVNAKALLNGGQTLNPAFDLNSRASLYSFSPDSAKFYFLANPAGIASTHIYEYNVATTQTTQISPAVFANAQTSSTISFSVRKHARWFFHFFNLFLFCKGDYLVFSARDQITSQTSLFSYNWKTGAAAVRLFSSLVGETPTFNAANVNDASGPFPA